MVTLTGAPGIGKTRLALEIASQVAETYPDGAWLAELAPITDPARLSNALASALSVPEVANQDLTDALVARLRERSLLIVLDNCEHVAPACAGLVDRLLRDCRQLQVLATSREPLGLPGEAVWQVPPLSVPDHTAPAAPEALLGYGAVRLFVERAAAIQPAFSLNPYIAPAVAEICRRLDGIPLAIELAAACVELLTPAEIARRLDDRFHLLAKGSRSALPGHRNLQTALDSSYELLSGPERALLRALSVFPGGFELEAVEGVCAGAEVPCDEMSALLDRLVAKSLVVADARGSPQNRYRLLETISAYAGERLEEAGEAPKLKDAHGRWYLRLAEEAEPELSGPGQVGWLERLEAERENLRSALEWSLGHGRTDWALRLAGALVLFWRVRCHFTEGRDLLEAAVSASEGQPPGMRAKALWGAGFLALMAGDPDRAAVTLQESLSIYRQLGDPAGCARALLILGNCRQHHKDPQTLALLEESASLARRAGDLWCLSHALAIAGLERSSHGELPAARPLFEECLEVARQAGDKQGLRLALLGLGWVALRLGDYRGAQSLLEDALAAAEEIGEDYSRATGLHCLGQLAIGRGEYEEARELIERAVRLIREVGSPSTALIVPLVSLGWVAYAQGDGSGARRLFEEGLALARAGAGSPIAALQGLGQLAAEAGDLSIARRSFEEALELASGDKSAEAQALHGLAELARAGDEAKRAVALHEEALELRHQIGDAAGITHSLEALAGLTVSAGHLHHAARHFGAAEALRKANGYARPHWESDRYEADVALLRRGLDADDCEAAWAGGARLSIDEAVVEASKRPRRRAQRAGWSSLTETERQVAGLVAEGLSNPEIATRLFISLGTVKAHLSNIFSKLGMAKRTELAVEVSRRR